MDYPSLLTAQLALRRPAPKIGRNAEERYWREQIDLPGLELRPLVSIATTCGVILMLLALASA